MSQFRGSRRVMARIEEARGAKTGNAAFQQARPTPDERALRRRLNVEALRPASPAAPDMPQLRKQAPKPEA